MKAIYVDRYYDIFEFPRIVWKIRFCKDDPEIITSHSDSETTSHADVKEIADSLKDIDSERYYLNGRLSTKETFINQIIRTYKTFRLMRRGLGP